MIARETIEAVLDRADIVQVISDAVGGLARRGHEFVCCCPFHNEKTASFHVNPGRGTWHCFGACQEGGDVISFVMKKEGVTFVEAVRQLAQRYGIDIDEEACLLHPYQPHTLRHYDGTLTDIRPAKTEFYF